MNVKILTNRNYENRPWFDLVREWENDCLNSHSFHADMQYEYFIFKNRYWQLVPGLFYSNIRNAPFPLLYFEMRANVFHLWKRSKTLVPWIIDWFVDSKQTWLYEWMYANHRLVLVSSREVYCHLKRQGSKINAEHLALSLSDRYRIQGDEVFPKEYDVILLGRQNEKLLAFLSHYKEKYPSLSIYRPSKGELDTRDKYMSVMRKGRIGLYATPGFDGDEKRTHGFSQVTPRFLEMIASGCHIIARYRKNEDTDYYELEKFSPNVESYEQFEMLMDKAMTTPVDMINYSEYLKKHYTSTRCEELKKILSRYE